MGNEVKFSTKFTFFLRITYTNEHIPPTLILFSLLNDVVVNVVVAMIDRFAEDCVVIAVLRKRGVVLGIQQEHGIPLHRYSGRNNSGILRRYSS